MFRRFIPPCAVVALAAGLGLAQGPPHVVKARLLMATDGVHPGSVAKAVVAAQVAPGYHINDHHPSLDYLIPTEVKFDSSPQASAKSVIYPKGRLTRFAFSDKPLSVYEGPVLIGVLLKLGRPNASSTIPIKGKLTYQACNDHSCLPPTSVPIALTVRVLPPGVPLKPANAAVFSKIHFQ